MKAASEGGILNGETGEDVARKAQRIKRHVEEFQGCVGSVERCEKRMFFLLKLLKFLR